MKHRLKTAAIAAGILAFAALAALSLWLHVEFIRWAVQG